MPSNRRTATVVGVLFLVTHVTSIAAVALYGPVLHHADYVVGPGPDTQVLLGVFLEVVLALAIVGTAVTLFPIVKRQNEGVALGYVGLRTLEAGVIAVGVVPLLAVVTLRQDSAGTAGADATALGSALVAFHNWTFLVGPSFICGTNTVLLAYLLYRSGLVPRFIPVLGLVGGPLVFASGTAQMFGIYQQISVWAAIAAIPVFAWELCLALYLILKGFRSPASGGLATAPVVADAHPVAG
ncbi:DUF4386 domain-containing protein [Micromonospora coerulea]|uniref:DUF4386 domain-containing protein n=1 Tax=Micromonospora coerulea TaxID=47856 RepID=UPI001907D235|nr:DUF4386 domain-containing protein [Micromonospora veneta]